MFIILLGYLLKQSDTENLKLFPKEIKIYQLNLYKYKNS